METYAIREKHTGMIWRCPGVTREEVDRTVALWRRRRQDVSDDEAETRHILDDRLIPRHPRAMIAELQTTIDRRVAADQQRILERHARAAREWPGGEPIREDDDPGMAPQFMLGVFVGVVLGLLAGIGGTLLVQGVM